MDPEARSDVQFSHEESVSNAGSKLSFEKDIKQTQMHYIKKTMYEKKLKMIRKFNKKLNKHKKMFI